MAEKRWTVSSTWSINYRPDFLETANFFGKNLEIFDLEINPHQGHNDELFWAITMTCLRKDAPKFGELLVEFDKLIESQAFMSEDEIKNNEEHDYEDLPF